MRGGDMQIFEKLNIGTGFILVVVGIISFFEQMYPSGFSWFIFGAMYLVMDSYRPSPERQKPEYKAMLIRKAFSIVGFLAAVALTIYTLAL